MASNEDYLDSLLKAAMESENETEVTLNAEENIVNEMDSTSDPNRSLTPDEIAAMFAMSESQEAPKEERTEQTVLGTTYDEAKEVTYDEVDSTVSVDAEESLDDLLADLTPELNFDSVMSEMADFPDIPDSIESVEEIIAEEKPEEQQPEEQSEEQSEESHQVEEEMEFDLDGVDDIDALLGLKEMPDNYKDELRHDKKDDEELPIPDSEADAPISESVDEPMDLEDQDLSDILDLLGSDDSELAEINDILKKSDNNELVDGESIDDLISSFYTDDEDASSKTDDESDGDEEQKSDKKSKKDKKKKKKKGLFGKKSSDDEEEKNDEDNQADQNADSKSDDETSKDDKAGEKKKSFLSKMFDALTEEVEDEEDAPQEKEKPKKKKKDKKKGKDAATSNEDILDELDEEDAAASKKKKKEKKPKKKKEKKPKKVKEPIEEEPTKKLPKKMVIRIFVLCFSILVVLLIANTFLPKIISLQNARKLFYSGYYNEAYQELIAQDKLSESDTILLEKSEMLMKMKFRINMYLAYHASGSDENALNELLQGVSYYVDNQEKFVTYGIVYEAEQEYDSLLALLSMQYGLDVNSALEIIQLDSVSYTYKIREIVSQEDQVLFETDITDDDATEQSQTDITELNDPLVEELE